MRDPARIQRILAKLEQLWAASPDARLGQLLVNVLPAETYVSGQFKQHLFYLEDSTLETLLDARAERA